jgi:hypothetical protein
MGNAAKILDIPTAEVFEPLLYPARYKGAHGGRGSGKSHFFAEMLIEDHIRHPGMRSVCIREVQKSLKESAKRLLEDKIQKLGVTMLFDAQADRIITPGNGVIIFQGMQDHTAESIKSLEGFRRAWVEEAQTLSARSLELHAQRCARKIQSYGLAGTRAQRMILLTACSGQAMNHRVRCALSQTGIITRGFRQCWSAKGKTAKPKTLIAIRTSGKATTSR